MNAPTQHSDPTLHEADSLSASDQSRAALDHWMHDFRNALGTATLAASAVRSEIEPCRNEQVDILMRQIEEGCERCMRLLNTMPR